MDPDTNQKITTKARNFNPVMGALFLIAIVLVVLNIIQRSSYTKKLNLAQNQFSSEIQNAKNSNDCSQCNPITDIRTPILPEGEFKIYNSDNLGVSFTYYDNTKISPSDALKIVEKNNKIFIADAKSTDVTRGSKYIEIFQKDPNLSLNDTIKQKIIKQENLDKCEIVKYDNRAAILNPTYEFLYVQVINADKMSADEVIQKNASCSHGVFFASGMGYFVMDKGHPNKFAYIYIGQSPFAFPFNNGDNGNNIDWDSTISFY